MICEKKIITQYLQLYHNKIEMIISIQSIFVDMYIIETECLNFVNSFNTVEK